MCCEHSVWRCYVRSRYSDGNVIKPVRNHYAPVRDTLVPGAGVGQERVPVFTFGAFDNPVQICFSPVQVMSALDQAGAKPGWPISVANRSK